MSLCREHNTRAISIILVPGSETPTLLKKYKRTLNTQIFLTLGQFLAREKDHKKNHKSEFPCGSASERGSIVAAVALVITVAMVQSLTQEPSNGRGGEVDVAKKIGKRKAISQSGLSSNPNATII